MMRVDSFCRSRVFMTDIPGYFWKRHAFLCKPAYCRVSENVRRHTLKSGPFAGSLYRVFHIGNRLAVPLDHIPCQRGPSFRPSQHRQQPIRDWNDGPNLLGLFPSGNVEVDYPDIEVNLAPPQGENSFLARSGVKRNPNKQTNVRGLRGPQQSRRFISGKPAVFGFRAFRHPDVRGLCQPVVAHVMFN